MIQVTNLNKSFGTLKAVNQVNLNIKEGEIFGLLGPNGAGKSTTINLISSLLKADSGSIVLNGINLNTHPILAKNSIGIVPQEISLYDNFSAYDNLLFFGKLYKVDRITLKQRIDEILVLIGLENRKDDLIKTYSGGMKRRINIAAALLHKPKILLMDEPTVGVDPQSRNRIFEVVETLNMQGLTIIYTTHYMEEVERLCNRIAIMDTGKIIAQGTLKELQEQSKTTEKVAFTFNDLSKEQFTAFKKDIAFEMQQTENTVTINCNINKDLGNILAYCTSKSIEVSDIKVIKANLEAIFLDLTNKRLRD